jgi:branched-chain amino acid transport system ATP-binding protein
MTPILDVNQLTMRFGGLVAVDNVTFDLSADQILAVIGPNGAGKTTVFNAITGLYRPTSGEVKFNGILTNKLSPDKIAQLGIRRTFQQSRLFDELSVLDNVLIGMAPLCKNNLVKAILRRDLLNIDFKEEIAKTTTLLEQFSPFLAGNRLRRAGDLVPGERRKLEICRALASKPKVLLLDEPAAGMNPKEAEDLTIFIKEIRDEFKLTIFMIEHHMDVVMGISQRIYVLDYGVTIAQGDPYEIQNNQKVIDAYLGVEEYA